MSRTAFITARRQLSKTKDIMKRRHTNTIKIENKRLKSNMKYEGMLENSKQISFMDLINIPTTYIFDKIAKNLDTRSILALGQTCKSIEEKTENCFRKRHAFETDLVLSESKNETNRSTSVLGYGSPEIGRTNKGEASYGWRLGQERFCKNWMYWRKLRELLITQVRSIGEQNNYTRWFSHLEQLVNKRRSKQRTVERDLKSKKQKKHRSNDHEITWSNEGLFLKELAKAEEYNKEYDLLGIDNDRFRILDCIVLDEWIIAKAEEYTLGRTFPEVIMINKYGTERLKFQSDNLDELTKEAIKDKPTIRRLEIQLQNCQRIGWSFERPPIQKAFGERNRSSRRAKQGSQVTIRTTYEQDTDTRIVTFNISSKWIVNSRGFEDFPSLTHRVSKINWTITRNKYD